MEDSTYEPYASIDDLAGKRVPPNGALSMARFLRGRLLTATDLDISDTLVAAPVTLVAGTTVVMTVTDVQGVAYEVLVREAP